MNLREHIWIPMLAAAMSLPAAGAGQQQGGEGQRVEPVPPVSTGQTAPGPSLSPAPPPVSPALPAAEEATPGTVQAPLSYFLPSFQLFETADSNFLLTTGPHRFETVSTLTGRLALQRAGKLSKVTVDYIGGGTIYTHHSEFNTTMHQLGITETYQGRRWGWLFDDRASYLPESNFGYGGFGWGGSLGTDIGGAFGSNLANLNPMFNPNQWLYTGRGSRLANTAIAQVQYNVGPRSSFNLGGTYELLHFQSAGSIDTWNTLYIASYDRTLSGRDTLGVTYGLNQLRFRHIGESFQVHSLEMDYGHRVTGRLALQAGGGGEVSLFSHPVVGSDTAPSWIAHASLNYNVHRSAFALSYARYTTNGGGVLVGAYTQTVEFSWNRQLTRHWSGFLGPGYARNHSLPQTTVGKTQTTYDSVYAGTSLSYSLGRYTTMFFNYRWENQASQATPCLAGNCRASLLRHLVGFGFDWHPRQLRIE